MQLSLNEYSTREENRPSITAKNAVYNEVHTRVYPEMQHLLAQLRPEAPNLEAVCVLKYQNYTDQPRASE